MEAEIIKSDSEGITIQIRILCSKEMLTTEEAIQAAVNAAGRLAAQHALSQFDTDGSPIAVEKKKHTSKGQISKPVNALSGSSSCAVMCIKVMKEAPLTVLLTTVRGYWFAAPPNLRKV
jgi:hypothetical protein